MSESQAVCMVSSMMHKTFSSYHPKPHMDPVPGHCTPTLYPQIPMQHGPTSSVVSSVTSPASSMTLSPVVGPSLTALIHPVGKKTGIRKQVARTKGGTRRCSFPECEKASKSGGFCISHGGGKKCKINGCTTSVVSRGFCVAHGGGTRCQNEGCKKSAQSGGFCWIHGGGKKCGFQGCTKRAQSGGACISHGGGKRCRIKGCTKVVQFEGLCVGHGGYRRCLSINCSKKALANGYCPGHGGSSKCAVEECGRKARRGGHCSAHRDLNEGSGRNSSKTLSPKNNKTLKHSSSSSSISTISSSPGTTPVVSGHFGRPDAVKSEVPKLESITLSPHALQTIPLKTHRPEILPSLEAVTHRSLSTPVHKYRQSPLHGIQIRSPLRKSPYAGRARHPMHRPHIRSSSTIPASFQHQNKHPQVAYSSNASSTSIPSSRPSWLPRREGIVHHFSPSHHQERHRPQLYLGDSPSAHRH